MMIAELTSCKIGLSLLLSVRPLHLFISAELMRIVSLRARYWVFIDETFCETLVTRLDVDYVDHFSRVRNE